MCGWVGGGGGGDGRYSICNDGFVQELKKLGVGGGGDERVNPCHKPQLNEKSKKSIYPKYLNTEHC